MMVTQQELAAATSALEKEMGYNLSVAEFISMKPPSAGHLARVAIEAAERTRNRPSGLYDHWGEPIPMCRVSRNDSRITPDTELEPLEVVE